MGGYNGIRLYWRFKSSTMVQHTINLLIYYGNIGMLIMKLLLILLSLILSHSVAGLNLL